MYITHGVGSYAYPMLRLCIHTSVDLKNQIWWFSMIKHIKTKILSYHMLNFIKKKKNMNYKIFHSIFYISIICQKKRHAKSFKDTAFKLNHIKLDREGFIVIQYGVIRCKTVAVFLFLTNS